MSLRRHSSLIIYVGGLFLYGQLTYAAPLQDGQDAPPPKFDSRALSHYLDGDLYMLQDDYRKAAASYEMALRFDTTSATIYLGLAEALLNDGRPKMSFKAAERAQKLEPEDPRVYQFLARNAMARNDNSAAIDYLDKWALYAPESVDPLFKKAAIFIGLKRFEEAVDTYLIIYDKDPTQRHVLERAGEISLSLGDLERAYQTYQRLSKALPEDGAVARTFAEIILRSERHEEALKVFEWLVETGNATATTRLQLAWLYRRLDRLSDSQAVLSSLLDDGQRQWDVLSMAGQVASQLDDYSKLAAISQLMIETYPDSVGGYTGLAIAKAFTKDEDGAISILEEALPRFKKNIDANYLLGNLYHSTKRYDDAVQHLLIALRQRPTARYIQKLLASAWSGAAKYQESDSLYEELLQSAEEDPVILNNYAYSLAERPEVSKKQLKYAKALSRKSIKHVKDSSSFLDTYGWIYYRLGNYRKAKKYIAASLAIDEANATVLEHMAKVYENLGKPADAQEFYIKAAQQREDKKNQAIGVKNE